MAEVGVASAPADDDGGLIFQWERRARSRWRLALMLVVSFLVHAGSFYVFQAAYTPTGTQLPPPAQVVLVPLDRPEYAPLARWLATNDPALTTRPAAPPAAQTLASVGFAYVPSYDAAQPPFKPLDRTENVPSRPAPPRPVLPGPVPVPPSAVAPAAPAREVGQTTRLVLSGPIAVRDGDAPLPPVRFRVDEGANVLDPTVFLVGVRADGGEPLVFRQSTSGSAAIDAYARSYLAGVPLQATVPGDTPAWGTATFYWGNDVYQ